MKFITSTLLSLSACGIAHAAPHSLDVLEGEYKLASSTTVPASSWGFSKARISIRKLDEHHVVILLACEWKRVAKAACDDYYFAQSRDGGIYIQDVNTDSMRLYFDPASRTLSMIHVASMRRPQCGATFSPRRKTHSTMQPWHAA